MTRFVIFSDLDGTLLDHDTYSFAEAKPALDRIKAAGIPLVLVSSKTRLEIEAIRRDLDNQAPFISENGGAVYIPEDIDLPDASESVKINDYQVIILGRRSSEIAKCFDLLAARVSVRALSRLPDETVAELTGLSPSQAGMAKHREYGEVFILDDPRVSETELGDMVSALGLNLTKGGRFYHLLGENDKGRAVSVLSDLYRRRYRDIVTAACGDAPNDEPMLAAVDRPFLVARPDGSHCCDAPGLVRIPAVGPAGFNQAVLSLLEVRPV